MNKLAQECLERLDTLATTKGLPGSPLTQYLEMGLSLWKEHGVDIFFRNAPHMIIVSAPKDGPSPETDTIISLSYLELAAQSMGLGTLWNGLAKALICDLFPNVQNRLGIPANHHIGYVMVLGKSAINYVRTTELGRPGYTGPNCNFPTDVS